MCRAKIIFWPTVYQECNWNSFENRQDNIRLLSILILKTGKTKQQVYGHCQYIGRKIVKILTNCNNLNIIIGGQRTVRKKNCQSILEDRDSSDSSSSVISTAALEVFVDKLCLERNRSSTRRTYYMVWHQFNEFFLLD